MLLSGILVFGALAAWFARTLSTGRIDIPKTYVWIAAPVFLGFVLISTIFSDARTVSFLGNSNQPDTLMSFVIYLGALFIVPIFLRDISHIMKAIFFFGGSLVILSIYALLQFFGIFIIPLEFAQISSFNPVGTVQALAVFLGAGLALFVALLTSLNLSSRFKALLITGTVLLGSVLIFVNFSYVWLGLLIVFALIVSWQIMHMRNAGQVMTKFNLPMFLIVIVAILFFIQPPITNIVNLPTTISPSPSSTINIATESYKNNIENALIGSGPATFLYEYLKYRPLELNNTSFFGVRFGQGFSAISTFLTTLGILGVLSFLILMGYLLWQSMKGIALLAKNNSPYEKTAFVAFVAMVFLVFMWFLHPVNFTIFLSTFLLGGIVLASLRAGGALSEWSLVFSKSPQRVFILSFLTVILLTVTILGVYLHGQKYIAAFMHTQGVKAFNTQENISDAISSVNLALRLEDNDRYWRTMAQLMVLQENKILQNTELDESTRRTNFEQTLQVAIRSAQRATQSNPADPLNWEQLASVYDNVLFIVRGADVFAIENYMEAASRNPKNPAAEYTLGQVYVRASDNARTLASAMRAGEGSEEEIDALEKMREEYLVKAIDRLEASLVLKSDYAPAHFLIAQIYERQGNRPGAIEKTAEVRDLNPRDVGVGYQLGLLYYFDDQINSAQREFERVLLLNPNYSNARYFLGLVYDKKGEKQQAIDQFQAVLDLNPGNTEIDKIIENLKLGAPALEGLQNPQDSTETPVPDSVPETSNEEENI